MVAPCAATATRLKLVMGNVIPSPGPSTNPAPDTALLPHGASLVVTPPTNRTPALPLSDLIVICEQSPDKSVEPPELAVANKMLRARTLVGMFWRMVLPLIVTILPEIFTTFPLMVTVLPFMFIIFPLMVTACPLTEVVTACPEMAATWPLVLMMLPLTVTAAPLKLPWMMAPEILTLMKLPDTDTAFPDTLKVGPEIVTKFVPEASCTTFWPEVSCTKFTPLASMALTVVPATVVAGRI